MTPCRIKPADAIRRGVLFAALTSSAALSGCSPEGSGTIKVENPQATRSKFGGDVAREKASTEKQAKALSIEEEAAKKNPKLR